MIGLRRLRSPLLIGLVTVVACASPATSPATSPPAPIASTRSATPTVSPRPRSNSVQVVAVAALPKDFVYVESAPQRDATLWLVDLSGASPPVAVARWTLGSETSSVSADGTTVMVEAHGAQSVIALHLVRPLTGEASILYEGAPDSRAFYAHVSPDGKRFSFALGNAGGWFGLWVGTVEDGIVRRLTPQPVTQGTGPMYNIGWTDDSTSVLYLAPTDTDPFQTVIVHNVITDQRYAVAEASQVSWRSREPRGLLAFIGGKGNQGAFGASVFTYDTAQQKRTVLFSIDPRITQLTWSPARDEFLYLAEPGGCRYHAQLWVTALTGQPRRVGTLDTVQSAWWSSDGSTIYALVRGTAQDGRVIDVMSGRMIATIPGDVWNATCP